MKRFLFLLVGVVFSLPPAMAIGQEDGFHDILQCYFQNDLAYRFTDESRSALKFVDPINYSIIHSDHFTYYYSTGQSAVISEDVNIDGTSYPVVEIDGYSFTLASFVKVHIPATVKRIGSHSFTRCLNLNEVTLPAEIEPFEDCFNYCEGLKTVRSEMSEPWDISSGWNNFIGVTPDNCILIVPEGTAMAYVNNGWGKYFSIQEENGNGTPGASGVDNPELSGNTSVRYFLPSGMEIASDILVPGTLYIRVDGGKSEKVIFRDNR